MKKLLLFAAFICFGANAQTITHSNSMALGNTLVACNNGSGAAATSSDNRYFRYFSLADFGLAAGYAVTSVQYGVQSLNTPTLIDGFPVTTKIYMTVNNNFPTGYPTGYVELASVTTNHVTADVGTLVSIPITAVIPPGSNLLVEVGYAAQAAGSLNRIFLSANDAGQSAPTYLSSTVCNFLTPTSLTAQFPNAHLILSVTGTSLGLSKSVLNEISVYPNPTKDLINFQLPQHVAVQKAFMIDLTGKRIGLPINENAVDISRFDAGVYMLTLETNEGNVTRKVIKM